MKETKLHYCFDNPNPLELTADCLIKLFVEVNREKVDEAIRQATQSQPELHDQLPEDKFPATAGAV